MLKLLLLYAHLMATCIAIGMIAMTDVRLLVRMGAYKVRVLPPRPLEVVIIASALGLLFATGVPLVGLAMVDDANALSNPKLQGKLLLVAVLTLNAVLLHRAVFPWLARAVPVARWRRRRLALVSLSAGLSSSLWLYCAFLGIARAWSNTVALEQVLLPALVLWLGCALCARGVLVLAAREAPRATPDLVDTMKSTLSGLGEMGGYRHDFEPPEPGTSVPHGPG